MNCFKKNLAAISRAYPLLARTMENVKLSPEAPFSLEKTKSGYVTVRYKNAMLLHSARDPRHEADKAVRNGYGKHADAVILYGFGLGYYAEAINAVHSDIHIIVIEADIMFFRFVLGARDFCAVFDKKNITILLSPDNEEVIGVLRQLNVTDWRIIPLTNYVKHHNEVYSSLSTALDNLKNRRSVNRNTMDRFGRLWVGNFFHNLPRLIRKTSLDKLKNIMQEMPGLLLAAGPSLEKFLNEIPKLRQHAVVVAVDSALSILMQRKIEPDFVVVTDPQYWNSRHLDYCRGYRGAFLLDSAINPTVLRELQGDFFLMKSPFPFAQFFDQTIDNNIRFNSGGSVATTAWEFLNYLGCRQIYCAGLDLSYPGHISHCRGALSHRLALISGNRFLTQTTILWNALYRLCPHYVPNHDGGKTLSDRQLDIYRGWFSENCQKSDQTQTFTFSTQAGKIAGISPAAVSDLLAQPEVRKKIERLINNSRNEREKINVESLIIQIDNQLRGLLVRLDVLKKTIVKTVELVEQAGKETIITEKTIQEISLYEKKILADDLKESIGFIYYTMLEDIARLSDCQTIKENLAVSRQIYSALLESVNFYHDLIRRSITIIKTEDRKLPANKILT